MLEKEHEDFTNILRGRIVPGADPKIAKKAKACRDVLLEWKEQKEQEELPPLRLPRKEPIKKPPLIWQQLAYAVTIVLAIGIPLSIYYVPRIISNNGQPTEPPLGEIEKSSDFIYNDISVTSPHEEAVKFYKELLAINLKVTFPKQEGHIRRLTFQWQPSQTEALAGILARYNKKLPPEIFNSATLGFKDDKTKTTQ